MALKILQTNGCTPFGQFDGRDDEYLTLKGGEVVTLLPRALSTNDKATSDVFDGYQNPGTNRVVVTFPNPSSSRPLFLADDGIAGYGTLFGSVVGGVAGQVSSGGAVLGPHTSTGSGKVTLWSSPGLYAVSLNAVDQGATGMLPTSTTAVTGAAVNFVAATGLLTTAAGAGVSVGRFVEFETNGSLVTTPSNLVGTLNPPDGALSASARNYTFAVFYFNPPVG